MSYNKAKACGICHSRAEIHATLEQIEKLAELRKSYDNHIGKIVLEESVALQWKDIQKILERSRVVVECLRKTLFWKIPRMRHMTEFVVERLFVDRTMGPCDFADFLQEFMEREQTVGDIQFLKWILLSTSRCARVFKTLI
jgi:hypothetical protein